MDLVIGGYLIGLSMEDMRRKKLSLWVLGIGGIGSFLYSIIYAGIFGVVAGSIPGVILLILSRLLPESVGAGDGILAVIYGVCYGWQKACIWLMFSFFAAAVFGVFFSFFRKEKSMKIPFVPFLALVHVGMCL